ncbi:MULTISPECIES: type IV pilus modification protein PilV [Spongiibacter]|uniref:type IV pilus modification protein PilV n=1 Tax=Spongiibacter TaxID=630749 RepID=UPI000C69EF9E|nr:MULTISPECIES: type IV pilus modification protein PilV [Spongiibacter]MAY38378.1 type IV pilus modification protein PilV [Spongiibacter sp.]MBI59063.1 type IV pilus modification protein PilV [Spongiibacter sp.]MBO6752895.1 type IV pilus modification protein PilV [Spongiibacter sp.]|tara:strand:- start:8372 stop:8827 length:456 start_codon:yes stop_codon:yes gene_type:complete
MRKRIRLPQHQRGTTLIEVLVAILVTAIGVMGAAAVQLNAVKFNQTAKFRSTAVFLANDIADRLRANRAAALNGDYDIAMDDDAPSGTSIDVVDLSEWLGELALRMPSGDGEVARDDRRFTITIQWDESRLSDTREAGSGNLQSFQFITEL